MILLVQSLIFLSYIYETYKYSFLEMVAAAKHRLQTLCREWRNLQSQLVTHLCRCYSDIVHLCMPSTLQQTQQELKHLNLKCIRSYCEEKPHRFHKDTVVPPTCL